ncbi:MAG: DUF4838 domain-containing protein [Pedobacter sp.]|nr:MAG: DUF4838 domain-containing protein [Pedobacter sp.]
MLITEEMSMIWPYRFNTCFKYLHTGLCLGLFLLMQNTLNAQIKLVSKSKSAYKIIIPHQATSIEKKAAEELRKHLFEISDAKLNVVTDRDPAVELEICIGATNRNTFAGIKPEGFLIKTIGKRLFIVGGGDKGTLNGVYHFLEEKLGCRMYTPELKYVPKNDNISFTDINDLQNPRFRFRQVYYPPQYNEAYLNWHKLHLIEDVWGLWGHTFDKLVPPSVHFKEHPEYYSLVNGERKPMQLCLSNKKVLEIAVNNLSELINAHPEKRMWSVSQNDGFGYCTCDACSAIDTKHGGPQGSVINFVNQMAERFPDKTISTLAYLYSKQPPVTIKPVKNVSIMLSTIDLNRAASIASDPRSTSFRSALRGWLALTDDVMVWDYVVQFTNYMSPFPNLNTLQSNMNYFGVSGIGGAFVQGTENTIGEFSELKSYLLAKLIWKPELDINAAKLEFMEAYYGKAAPFLLRYQEQLQLELKHSGKLLDIYGDPVSEWNSWLTPEQIVNYDDLFEQAAFAVRREPRFLKNVETERLALEYTVLQQARFYGIEKHGAFIKEGTGWSVKPGFAAKVSRFVTGARAAGLKELAEGGPTLESYKIEWDGILKQGPLLHDALGKKVEIIEPYHADYPAKGARTLTDGSVGYNNFQYNYLGWHGTDMEVVVHMGSSQVVKNVTVGVLEDQRHWAFLPKQIEVSTSIDGIKFSNGASLKLELPEENYEKSTRRFTISLPDHDPVRYIKVRALKLDRLPEWRDLPNRQSWIFCDEIEVH